MIIVAVVSAGTRWLPGITGKNNIVVSEGRRAADGGRMAGKNDLLVVSGN